LGPLLLLLLLLLLLPVSHPLARHPQLVWCRRHHHKLGPNLKQVEDR
jgi:hypothetical protein